MIKKLLSAGAVILGDLIDGWALKQSRHELLETIHTQAKRINELEEELDRNAQELYELRDDYDQLLDQSGLGAYMPGSPFQPSKPPESCAGVTPPTKTVDPFDVPQTTRQLCSECGKYFEYCVCIPF